MEWLCFVLLIALVIVGFAVVRRPMYEVIFASFIIMVIITGKIGSIGTYMFDAANTYLLYTIAAFICFSIVFDKTGLINDMINIVVSLVGRFSGGAGYVALGSRAPLWALSPAPVRETPRQ